MGDVNFYITMQFILMIWEFGVEQENSVLQAKGY
jgi:hypothetical protein